MKQNNKNNEFNRIQRFSIRKYSFGAASVAIATYLMFMGNGAVYAAQEGVTEGTEPKAGEVVTPKEEPQVEAPKAEEIVKPATVVTPALDKTQLVAYIAEIELNISSNKYANKTEESVEKLKSKIEAAKSVVVNAKTQNDLKKAYNALVTSVNSGLRNKPAEVKPAPGVDTTNGKETVGKRAENTEPKEGTNAIENTGSHDSRNGKVMENGSGFRADVTAATHPEFTKTVGDITYSVEFSDDKLKEIYVYVLHPKS